MGHCTESHSWTWSWAVSANSVCRVTRRHCPVSKASGLPELPWRAICLCPHLFTKTATSQQQPQQNPEPCLQRTGDRPSSTSSAIDLVNKSINLVHQEASLFAFWRIWNNCEWTQSLSLLKLDGMHARRCRLLPLLCVSQVPSFWTADRPRHATSRVCCRALVPPPSVLTPGCLQPPHALRIEVESWPHVIGKQALTPWKWKPHLPYLWVLFHGIPFIFRRHLLSGV